MAVGAIDDSRESSVVLGKDLYSYFAKGKVRQCRRQILFPLKKSNNLKATPKKTNKQLDDYELFLIKDNAFLNYK